ncbi:MAG: ATP-binding cassette domain-containing protein [Chloroflexi bacterium]|nr:MAG: ATP-binding cassette domain-containing protein [Chloroflexota bacterium]
MDHAWRSSVSSSRRTSSVTGLGLGIHAIYRKSLAQGACAILLRILGALQLDHAAARVGGRLIWAEVDLEVQEGEFVAILGPNGAGKSTLLKALLGVVPLAEGSVRVFGRPVRRVGGYRCRRPRKQIGSPRWWSWLEPPPTRTGRSESFPAVSSSGS